MCGNTRLAKVKCIAILQIFIYIIYLVTTLVGWISVVIFEDRVKIYYHLGFITLLTIGTIGFILALVLFMGAKQQSITKCWFWFYGNSIFLGMWLVGAIFSAIFPGDILAAVGCLVAVLVTMYLLFIVYGYMMEFNEKVENPAVFVVSSRA